MKLHFKTFAYTLVAIFIMGNKCYAQNIQPCYTNQMWEKQVSAHPEILKKQQDIENFTQQFVANLEARRNSKKALSTDTITYIIPIVFHILHTYGPEDISDAEVFDEMRILNEDYAKLNADTVDIATPHFKRIATNVKIQWRLAQIDPNGKPTNGIDRIFTPLTNSADDNAKLNQWNPHHYVNVWVCKNIQQGGVASNGTILGYAYFPSEVDNNYMSIYDGVLINYQCIGSIGAAYKGPGGSWDRSLTHELGHVLNLEHPWGLTNNPGVACGDDGVNDTPVTEGYFSICPSDSTGAKKCDTITKNPLFIVTENWQNYMDYSMCANMFSLGQAERIWAALNYTAAGRDSLWMPSNLIATGVSDSLAVVALDTNQIESVAAPNADFYTPTCFVCQGSKVTFQDKSWNAKPTSWDWTFTGANVSTSNVQNPTVTYDSLYGQTVTLTSSDKVGGSSITKTNYIFVSPNWASYSGPFSEGFENANFIDNGWLFVNESDDRTYWQPTNKAAFSGNSCIYLNAYAPAIYAPNTNPPLLLSPAIAPNNIDDVITPAVSFQYLTSATLSFYYSYASSALDKIDLTEEMNLSYSLNCGQSWSTISTIQPSSLSNAGHCTGPFIPTSASQWIQYSIGLPAVLNGKSNVRFRLQYICGNSSNNIYIDNFNLTGTVGVNELSQPGYAAIVYPNPMTESAVISYVLPAKQILNIEVDNIVGQAVAKLVSNETETAGQHLVTFNRNGLSNGMYFVRILADNNLVAVRKVLITE